MCSLVQIPICNLNTTFLSTTESLCLLIQKTSSNANFTSAYIHHYHKMGNIKGRFLTPLGANIVNNNVTGYFNGEYYHTPAILLSIINNARLMAVNQVNYSKNPVYMQ